MNRGRQFEKHYKKEKKQHLFVKRTISCDFFLCDCLFYVQKDLLSILLGFIKKIDNCGGGFSILSLVINRETIIPIIKLNSSVLIIPLEYQY